MQMFEQKTKTQWKIKWKGKFIHENIIEIKELEFILKFPTIIQFRVEHLVNEANKSILYQNENSRGKMNKKPVKLLHIIHIQLYSWFISNVHVSRVLESD